MDEEPTPEAIDAQRSVIEQIIGLYKDEPWVSMLTTLTVALVAGVFLVVVVRAISRAGRVNPPKVVLSLLIALIGLVALIGVIIRPDVESLAVATGTAVGALAGALATAFQAKDNDEVEEQPCKDLDDEPDEDGAAE